MLVASLILATLFIQIPNIWAMNYFSADPTMSTAFKIALFCIPASIISTACFSYFFGKGYETLSYPAMAVMTYGVGLFASFFVHGVILRTKTFTTAELIGSAVILIGLAITILPKK